MRLPIRLAGFVALLVSSAALAADLLPLKQGIYVPVGRSCRGASNAEIVNYWGGNTSIGASQGECTIKTVSHKGSIYEINDKCRDIQSGDEIVGGPFVIKIITFASFRMAGVTYRYCGTKIQF